MRQQLPPERLGAARELLPAWYGPCLLLLALFFQRAAKGIARARIKVSGRLERAPSRPADVSVRFGQDKQGGTAGQDLRKAGIVFDNVTISYRGAGYEIGRGEHYYGIWAVAAPQSQPLEWWPETPEGWSGAWSRFTAIETPGTIMPVGRTTPPAGAALAGGRRHRGRGRAARRRRRLRDRRALPGLLAGASLARPARPSSCRT